jgi:hypothetical protein
MHQLGHRDHRHGHLHVAEILTDAAQKTLDRLFFRSASLMMLESSNTPRTAGSLPVDEP